MHGDSHTLPEKQSNMCHKAVRHNAVSCTLQTRSTAADCVNATRQAAKSEAGASESIKVVGSDVF